MKIIGTVTVNFEKGETLTVSRSMNDVIFIYPPREVVEIKFDEGRKISKIFEILSQ